MPFFIIAYGAPGALARLDGRDARRSIVRLITQRDASDPG